MVITESDLRQMWKDGKHPLPSFPPGTRFSPSAQDFLKEHQLQAKIEDAPAVSSPQPQSYSEQLPAWDKPGSFPVVLSGPVPVCSECGQPVHDKPEHMTQLDAGHFAAKTSPRIKLRGRLDTLHGLVMLAAAQARAYQLAQLAAHLDTLAAYCREIQSAEYNARPVQPLVVGGKSEEDIHQISHWPDRHLNMAHIVPGPEDHAILHWLNLLRATSREVEIQVLEVFTPPERADLARALNRLSSAVYYLELLFKKGDLSWSFHLG